jgi:hypothetical protein
MLTVRFATLAVLLAACSKGSSPPSTPPKNDAPPTPPVETGDVRVELTVEGRSLVITNYTGIPVRFQREILVQTKEEDVWVSVAASGLLLREQCTDPGGGLYEPPACVEIAAGATFRAAPWLGMVGDAQCACEECGPAEPGGYKMGVTPCDGGDPVWSAVFPLSPRE